MDRTMRPQRGSDRPHRRRRPRFAIAINTAISDTEPEFGTDLISEFPDGRRDRTTSDGLAVIMPPR